MARKGGADARSRCACIRVVMVRRYVDSNIDEFVRVPGGPKGGAKIARNPYYAFRACSK